MMNLTHSLAQTFWLPKPASNLASDVDFGFYLIYWVSVFFFVVVVGAMVLFIIKYRRRSLDQETSTVTHNTPLEILWSGLPLLIVIGIFWVGFKGFLDYDRAPSNVTIIGVEAKKWGFTFSYPNGAKSDQLVVALNEPVRLDMTSVDVLHALYIPAFRTQRNLIPGRLTNIWFQPTKVSKEEGFPAFCTQYCGKDHSAMVTRVHVLDNKTPDPKTGKTAFAAKMEELANPFVKKDGEKRTYVAYRDVGQKIAAQAGCFGCHSVDGKAGTGPTWQGLYKKDHQFSYSNEAGFTLTKGDSDEKWDAYIRESILRPGSKIVSPFANQMSPYESRFTGTPAREEELRAVMEYIRSLGPDYKPSEFSDEELDANKNPHHPQSMAAKAAAEKKD